jgi:Mg-chelatase subunit ChlD
MSGAIELVLDASGSMLQRLEGQRRIEIARSVLNRLVTKTLPAGTPLALRVFGHTRPGSCETALAVPLAPHAPEALTAQIAAIQPQNLAKTPIADSLREVAKDLAGARGPRTVVLVTDGEETCGGDPRAEIAALVSQGIDVRVNIVGFAVDDAGLKERFREWARTGGGEYFDAGNAEELSTALDAAVQVPFRVLDASGEVVARGSVGGEPVSVPPGTYRVEVETRTPTVFEAVGVEEGKLARVEFRDGGS